MKRTIEKLGLRPIHVACLDGDLEEVIRICIQGENPDVLTAEGATPLMLAALFGHTSILKFLLQKGAETAKKDREGHKARDYAKTNTINKKKRARFLALGLGPDVDNRETTRDILNSSRRLRDIRAETDTSCRSTYYVGKSTDKIMVFQLIETLGTGRSIAKHKTLGFIQAKNAQKPHKYALSGYSPPVEGASPRLLDAAKWSNAALHYVAPKIGFVIPASLRDNGSNMALPEHKGRARAGHVEVQLSTCYALELIGKVLGMPEASVEDLAKHLEILRTADLRDERIMTIILDYRPCCHCHNYIKALEEFTHISFNCVYKPSLGPVLIEKDFRGIRTEAVQTHFPDMQELELNDREEQDAQHVPATNDMTSTGMSLAPESLDIPEQSRMNIQVDFGMGEDDGCESDTTVGRHTPSPDPIASAHEHEFLNMTFAPQPVIPPERRSLELFRQHMRRFRYFNSRRDTRSYAERLRYRNPHPAPIYEDPYSSLHRHEHRAPPETPHRPVVAASTQLETPPMSNARPPMQFDTYCTSQFVFH